jgi:23S rRNA (uracil1939-C5)-methyltransferase
MLKELTIAALGPRGDGIAFDGTRPVYIPRSHIGDIVRAELTEDRDGNLRGRTVETLSRPRHVDAPCAHYATCGGCAVQHVAEADYRIWKQDSVKTLLARAGLDTEWREPVFLPEATRRRASFAAYRRGAEVTLGYHAAGSDAIAQIQSCLLLTPRLNALLDGLPQWLPRVMRDGRMDVFAQDVDGALDMVLTGASPFAKAGAGLNRLLAEMAAALDIARVSWRRDEFSNPEQMIALVGIRKKMGVLSVELPPGAFLQPSQPGEDALVALVMAALPRKAKAKIADLFAGCGTFSGAAMARGTVHAVESQKDAVRALTDAAKGLPELSVEQRDLGREPLTLRELRQYDAVIVDPPRAGAKSQCEKLARSEVRDIVSVSCNPASFARDGRILAAGGYRLVHVTLVDQFLWSHHAELVGLLSRG